MILISIIHFILFYFSIHILYLFSVRLILKSNIIILPTFRFDENWTNDNGIITIHIFFHKF